METMLRVKSMARYWMPGSFFAEDDARQIEERSAEAAVAVAPRGAFAFDLYDSPIADFEFPAQFFRVVPIPQNESEERWFLGGDVFTVEDLRRLAVEEGDPQKYETLILNITHACDEGVPGAVPWEVKGMDFGWRLPGRAIRTRLGNWQEFRSQDVLISTERCLELNPGLALPRG